MADPSRAVPPGKVPIHWKVAGTLVRSIFLILLVVVTARVTLPETINAEALAHFAMADFTRIAIGVVVCAFTFVQLFRRPADDDGYKAWSYIGLALAAVLLFVIVLKTGLPGLS